MSAQPGSGDIRVDAAGAVEITPGDRDAGAADPRGGELSLCEGVCCAAGAVECECAGRGAAGWALFHAGEFKVGGGAGAGVFGGGVMVFCGAAPPSPLAGEGSGARGTSEPGNPQEATAITSPWFSGSISARCSATTAAS